MKIKPTSLINISSLFKNFKLNILFNYFFKVNNNCVKCYVILIIIILI